MAVPRTVPRSERLRVGDDREAERPPRSHRPRPAVNLSAERTPRHLQPARPPAVGWGDRRPPRTRPPHTLPPPLFPSSAGPGARPRRAPCGAIGAARRRRPLRRIGCARTCAGRRRNAREAFARGPVPDDDEPELGVETGHRGDRPSHARRTIEPVHRQHHGALESQMAGGARSLRARCRRARPRARLAARGTLAHSRSLSSSDRKTIRGAAASMARVARVRGRPGGPPPRRMA